MKYADALTKTAKYNYTPNDWRKYTTPEERQASEDAEHAFLKGTGYYSPGARKANFRNLVFPGLWPVGLLASALTPTWTTEDVRAFADQENTDTKSRWIPGYNGYINGKLLGYQRELQQRVEQKAQEAKDQK